MIKVLLADDQELIRQSLSFVMSRQDKTSTTSWQGSDLQI